MIEFSETWFRIYCSVYSTKEFLHLEILSFPYFFFLFIYGKWSLLGPGGAAFDVSNALFLHIFVHEICLYETESNIPHPVCVIFKPYPPRSFISVRAYVWLYHAYSNTLFFIANKILLARQRKSSSCSFLFLSVSLFSFFHLPLFLSLSVIVKSEEWRYFKELTKTLTPLEEEMFHLKESTLTPQVYLRPKESVHIPFKYQTFICGRTFPLQVNLEETFVVVLCFQMYFSPILLILLLLFVHVILFCFVF